MGAGTSKMVLRICGKFFLVYLGTKDAVARIAIKYSPTGLAGWLDNSSSDLENGEKPERATERRSL